MKLGQWLTFVMPTKKNPFALSEGSRVMTPQGPATITHGVVHVKLDNPVMITDEDKILPNPGFTYPLHKVKGL